MSNYFDRFDETPDQGNYFDRFDTPVKEAEGGFIPAAKQAFGAVVKGAGQAAADLIPGVDQDNAVKRYGQGVIDANPTAVNSLSDIADRPGKAVTEATGNAAGSIGGMLAVRAAGQGVTALSPLAGPGAPVVAAIGQAISWLGPAAMAALPSYGGIRDKQILNDPAAEEDAKSKAVAALGAGAVGAIETAFGPQKWALALVSKEGRAAIAQKFAETTLGRGIAFGVLKGAAIEGAEELAQNPIEQLASGQDPRTPESLKDTAFGGAMGAIGGGVLGGGFGAGSNIGRRAPERPPEPDPVPDILNATTVDGAIEAARAATQERAAGLFEQQALGDPLQRALIGRRPDPVPDSATLTSGAELLESQPVNPLQAALRDGGPQEPMPEPARGIRDPSELLAQQGDPLQPLIQQRIARGEDFRTAEVEKTAELDAIQQEAAGLNLTTEGRGERARAVERAADLQAPTAMALALQRAKVAPEPAEQPTTGPAIFGNSEDAAPQVAQSVADEPRIIDRSPDLAPLPRKLAEQRAEATGGEVVRFPNIDRATGEPNGKFAYTVLKATDDRFRATSQPVLADAAGRRNPDAGTGMDAGVRAGAPVNPGMAAGDGVRQSNGQPVALDATGRAAVEPAQVWFGRRGDGYKTRPDAEMAIQGRRSAAPDLQWKVEAMPGGRFRLAGYSETTGAPVAESASTAQGSEGGVAPAPAASGPNLSRAAGIESGPAVVLQNRDRSSAASIAQMNEIAASPDYLRAGPARVMETGAPVAFGDIPATATVGRTEQIADGKGQRVTVQYAVVEAADVIASNTADGSAVPQYAEGAQGKLRAVAGNGRAAGIAEAYRRGTADQYRADLEADAQALGLDPTAIQGMKAPVLVRVMSSKDVTPDIGDRSNIAGTARLSAVEQAGTDARRIDLAALEFSEDGEPTAQAVTMFTAGMPTAERGELINRDGTPTRQAIDRLMAATFKQAYGSDELVRLYAQATDTEARTIMTALADAAGAMASLKDAGDLDIRGAVAEAAGIAVNARRRGQKLSDVLQNADMTVSGEAFEIARFFADNIRSAKRISEGLREWAGYVTQQVRTARDNEVQGGMFGDTPVADRAAVFRRLRAGQETTQGPADRAIEPRGARPAADGAERPRDDGGAGQAGAGVGAQEEGLSAPPVEGEARTLEAGPAEIAEAQAFRFKTKTIERLLSDGLDPTDGFDMHLLAIALKAGRAFNAAMSEHNGDPSGIEYRKPVDPKYPNLPEKYAVVLPDASREGKWRVSFFDKSGFSYHEVAPDVAGAVAEMVTGGFTIKDPGALDRLASTREWALGTDYAALIDRYNRKLITSDEFAAQQKALNDDYERDTKGLAAPTPADVVAQQDRAANAEALDARAQVDREAPLQSLSSQAAPEQRRDTTDDIFGGPSPEEVLAERQREEQRQAEKRAKDDGSQQSFLNIERGDRRIERVDDAIGYNEADDDFVYHVTSEPSAKKILRDGFSASARKLFRAGAYPAHSKGRVFFTERSGVPFWSGRVEDQLFDQHDDPPDVVVLRVPKDAVALEPDELGSKDANHPSYFVQGDAVAAIGRSTLPNIERGQTDTPAFRKWFAGSKVVDAQGRPLVVYHGTTADLDAFDLGFSGSDGVAYGSPAIFATDDALVASDYALNKRNRNISDAGRAFQRYKNEHPGRYDEEYERLFDAYKAAGQKEGWDTGMGANVLPVYLSIQDPLMVDGGGKKFMQVMPDAIAKAVAEGRDGLIVRNVIDHASPRSDYPVTVYIAFKPTQVKSATGNDGTFDATDPSITSNIERLGTTIARMGYARQDAPNIQPTRRLAGLVKRLQEGKITPERFQTEVAMLAEAMTGASEVKAANRVMTPRARGADLVKEKLLAARRRGDLDAPTVDFAMWALEKNPALALGLGLSVRSPGEDNRGVSGDYNPAAEIVRLFKGSKGDDTAVHEIMHHAERMMPPELQEAIRDEWIEKLTKVASKATPAQVEALNLIEPALIGDREAHRKLVKAIQGGPLNYEDHYQLINPSEFWAVNAARILGRRYRSTTVWEKVRAYLREMIEKGKGLVGMTSDAPILRALAEVLDPGRNIGERQSKRMLSDFRGRLENIDREAPDTEATKLRQAMKREEVQRLVVSKLEGWQKGDKIGGMTVERVNKDRDGYPASFNISGDGIIKGVDDKVDVVREFFERDKEAFRAMVDEARRDDTGTMFARRAPQPFYSALSSAIEDLNITGMPGAMWKDRIKGLINKGMVKADEVEWSGLNEWLDLQTGKVTKQQVVDFLKANGVQVQETTLGGAQGEAQAARDASAKVYDIIQQATEYISKKFGQVKAANASLAFHQDRPGQDSDRLEAAYDLLQKAAPEGYDINQINDAQDEYDAALRERSLANPPTKYGNYQLPGGENYREVLLTLPAPVNMARREAIFKEYQPRIDALYARIDAEKDRMAAQNLAADLAALQDERNEKAAREAGEVDRTLYRSSHWDEPNVLAHIRLNDRTDSSGARVLFVEEIQSDWAQDGRKKGFQGPMPEPVGRAEVRNGEWGVVDSAGNFWRSGSRAEAERSAGIVKPTGVPRAPFVEKTDAWLALALKRIMVMAAQDGYDRVAFVTGKQSADRYNLAKQVDEIRYLKQDNGTYDLAIKPKGEARSMMTLGGRSLAGLTESQLEEFVGKEVAQKIGAEEGRIGADKFRKLSGLDLEVGGEGMHAFYDQIVPAAVNKLLGKMGGGKVGAVNIDRTDYGKRGKPADWDKSYAIFGGQPGFPITDTMREKMAGGVPLFRRGESTPAGLTLNAFTEALTQAFGKGVAARLLKNGVVIPLENQGELPEHVVPFVRDDDKIFGFYDPKTDRTYAVLENLTPEMVKGLALHEVGVHYGFEAMLGKDKYNQVIQRVKMLGKAGDKDVKAALESAKKNAAKPSQVPEETLAYLIMNRPDMPLVKEIITKIKAWLFDKFGIGGKNLTIDDIAALARAAVLHSSRTEPGTRRPDFATAPAMSAEVLSPGKEFWRKIKAGESFTEQEAEDAWKMGRSGFVRQGRVRRTADAVSKRVRAGATAEWASEGSDFGRHVTLAREIGNDQIAIFVVPSGLIHTPGADLKETAQASAVTYLFTKTGPGLYELSILDPMPGGAAEAEMRARGILRENVGMDDDKEPYSRVELGTTLSGALMKEAIRRLAMHVGEVPSITFPNRDTGARAGKAGGGRTYSKEWIEAHFARRFSSLPGKRPTSSYVDATPRQQATLDRMDDGPEDSNYQLLPARESLQVSADSHFTDWEKEPGIKYVALDSLGLTGYDNAKDTARIRRLADAIKESGEIEPIFVGIDPNGEEYVMEGQHRARAMKMLGETHIPAQVVVSMEGEDSDYDALPDPTNAGPTDYKVAPGQMPMFARSVVTGQTLPQTWQGPDESRLDDLIYSMQDKHVDTKRVLQNVRQAIGTIADAQDPYLQEELYHGRAAKDVKDFLNDDLKPLLVDLQARGIDLSDFEEYLHNRHAERRNVQVAKVNLTMPDGGSGINTADARAYLAGLPAAKRTAFQALAARVDRITKGTRDMLVSSGLEKQETIDAWDAAYGTEYVPLMREEMDNARMGIGQGYSVRGSSSKRAMGSDKPVADIMANIAMQREKAITRLHKQKIGQALYGLVLTAPNSDFWMAIDPALEQSPAQIMATSMQLISMGMSPQDAESIAAEPTERYIGKDNLVHERINPALRSADNVLAVRIDGEDKYVFFNAKDPRAMRMATALKNLDADQLGTVMSGAAKITRYFASVNTQYNPIFGITNITRDVQGALLNLSSTPLAGKQAEVMKHVLPALRGIYIDLRDHRKGVAPTSSYAQIFEEFQREGGATGFRDMYANAKERADSIASELKAIKDGTAMKVGKGIMGWLSDYNEAMENAVRVAAYKVATEQGMSKQQAASLAKNLTVNFNRKGQVALQAGALYAFFNASVQGTARIAETLFQGGKLSTAGKRILQGGLLLGTMQALVLAAAGYDDEEPPDFVRERSLVLPVGGGKYISIPMPLGFHVIPNVARIPTEWAMSGFKNTPKRLGQFIGLFADAFNPIGSAGLSLQTLTPTIIDPLAALSENKGFTGKQIAREDFSALRPTAGHTRAKDTATPWARMISETVNWATGGTDYKPGLASPTPDQIDYLIGQATGGLGREVGKISQVASGTASGEEVPLYKIPLVGRFVGSTEGQAAQASRFYENLKTIGAHKVEIDGLRKDRKGSEVIAYMRENPDAMLVPLADRLQREVSKMTQAKRDMLKANAGADRIKLMDERIAALMRTLNNRVRAMEPA